MWPASTDHFSASLRPIMDSAKALSQELASAADGRLNTRLDEPLGVTGRDVMHAAIAVMHQCIFWVKLTLVQRLLEPIANDA